MKKYSIIHLPVLSFFSKDLYRDVGLNWKGICFGYLFIFLAICWIPIMVKIHTGFSAFVKNDAPPIIDQIPEITITDGQVSIEEPQPYFIKDPDNNDILAVIDTTGTITSPSDANAFFLLTENMMITQTEFETRSIDLSQFDGFSISGDLSITDHTVMVATGLAVFMGSMAFIYGIVPLFTGVQRIAVVILIATSCLMLINGHFIKINTV